MELEMSITKVHKRDSNEGQPQPNSLEGFNPRVEWRETRSSYFLNVIFQGLNKDDIHLEMDKSRSLIIRGQRDLQDVGMVGWRWRVVEQARPTSSRRARRPFTIPQDVNVGAITAHLHHATLQVTMPKLSRTTFTPYHISIRPSKSNHQRSDRPRPQRKHAKILQAESADENCMEHKTCISPRSVGEDDDVPMIITVEDQNSPPAHGQSGEASVPHEGPNAIFEKQMKQQQRGYPEMEPRPMEVGQPDDWQTSPSSRLRSKEKDMQDTKEEQDAHRCPSPCLYANLERICSGHEECSGIQRRGHSKPSLCKGLCQLLACVGAMTACKLRR